MKKWRGLFFVILVVGVVAAWQTNVIPSTWQSAVESSVTSLVADLRGEVQTLNGATTDHNTVTTTQTTKSDTGTATPVMAIVKGTALKKTYTYSFKAGTNAHVKALFKAAVAIYNQTGVVKLTAGKAVSGGNHITFGETDQASHLQANAIELGVGGPVITTRHSLFGTSSTNAGHATLNVYYPQAYRLSVALHETGHALGLDHSASHTSIMYPVDQGLTSLSAADVAALKSIYD